MAAAHGVEGPGDTVLLKRSGGGAVSKTLKVAAVSASILATGAAWRYGSAPKAEPPRDASALALEPAARAAGSTEGQPANASSSTWQRSVTVQQLGAPAPEPERASEPPEPAQLPEPPEAQPTVRVLAAEGSASPAHTDEDGRSPSEPAAAPPRRPRPRPRAVRPASHSTSDSAPHSPRPASPPAAAATGEKPSDEYDFGIDELPAPKGRKNVIRTTLD